MLNLNVYSNKELQHFLAMLNQCESSGVSDVRFVRQQIQRHIESQYREQKVRARQAGPVKEIKSKTCPSCGQSLLIPVQNREGLNILGCKKCRYSEIAS